jgi:CheY-like chemotaxis protein
LKPFPLVGEPVRQFAFAHLRQVSQQLREIQLSVDVVPATSTGEAGQDRRRSAAAWIAHEEAVLAIKNTVYSVVVFHTPLEATRCDLSMFNLAILDFEMPWLNGRELLLRMRALGARFPIVLLTGRLATLSHGDRILFSRCIEKDMPMDLLLDTITNFLDPNQGPDYGS